MAIESRWEEYFGVLGEGLGTTYERFILHRYWERLGRECRIANALEIPSFGITGISGINSMWWAAHDVPVTVVDCDEKRIELIRKVWERVGLRVNLVYEKNFGSLPFGDKSFDLSWNFCALRLIQESRRLLEEMARVTRKAIFICIPNRTGIASRIRGFFEKDDLASRANGDTRAERVTLALHGLGWTCREQGYFDVPPWPDIAMKKEEFLKKIGMGWLSELLMKRDREEISILDYFKGDKDMERRIMKYSFLENSPTLFKRFWAHHEYFLFSPKES